MSCTFCTSYKLKQNVSSCHVQNIGPFLSIVPELILYVPAAIVFTICYFSVVVFVVISACTSACLGYYVRTPYLHSSITLVTELNYHGSFSLIAVMPHIHF